MAAVYDTGVAVIVVAGTVTADIVIDGMARFPGFGELEMIDTAAIRLGGCVGNTGRTLSTFGIPTAAITRVGRDYWGEFIRREIADWAEQQDVVEDEHAQSPVTVVFVSQHGARAFIHAQGALRRFSDAQIRAPGVLNARVEALHLGYALLLPELSAQDVKALLRTASETGIFTSLDVAWQSQLDWREVVPILAQVDLFCPSYKEARAITGRQEPHDIADMLLGMGVRQAVAVTQGEDGAFLADREGHREYIPAYRSGDAVDTTGAGDVFIATMLAGWHRGLNWPAAARRAVVAAGISVIAPGVAGVPDWNMIESGMSHGTS